MVVLERFQFARHATQSPAITLNLKGFMLIWNLLLIQLEYAREILMAFSAKWIFNSVHIAHYTRLLELLNE